MLGLPRTPPSVERLRAIDAFLAESYADLRKHDDRLRAVGVEIRFDRGVAHLTGEVADPRELRFVRRVVGRLDGVLALWSRVSVDGREPVMLDLGCGDTKQYASNVGIDLRPARGADVLADLSRSLPVAADSVDAILAVHVLEHLIDFLALVDDCHRVLRPGGTLHVMSPWWGHVNAVADPTHVRLLDVQTIKGICLRPPGAPRWYPLHAGYDGASVFADLTPLGPDDPGPDASQLARFFD
ncbi:MAG TPA: methyltransferase domain-containing protein [Micromonosporaceae bacterium]